MSDQRDYDETTFPTQHDLRRREMGPWETPPPIDQQTEKMNERLQAIHCRLLERATGGRLTFQGDTIVRVRDGVARPPKPLPPEREPDLEDAPEPAIDDWPHVWPVPRDLAPLYGRAYAGLSDGARGSAVASDAELDILDKNIYNDGHVHSAACGEGVSEIACRERFTGGLAEPKLYGQSGR